LGKNDFRVFSKQIAGSDYCEKAFEAGFKNLDSSGGESLNFEDIKLIVLNDLRTKGVLDE